jgi:hypothetical protein
MCTPNTKTFPSDWDLSKWRFPTSPFDRDNYAKLLTDMLQDELETIEDQLNTFDPNVLIPAASDITYEYPDFSEFTGLFPSRPPIVIDIPDNLDELRPDFIALTPVTDVNIPEWTLGEITIDIDGLPDPETPDFTEDAPAITYPSMPIMFVPADPDEPIINPVPIPQIEEVDFPYFDETAPELTLIEPALDINPGDNDYQSRVKDAVEAWLYDQVIHGGTGLAPEVEDAIYQRESERSLQTHADQLTRLRSDWSKTHMPLPTSMLFAIVNEAEIDYTNKRHDVSRDIMIKQAELAQTNTHFVIQQALAYEQMMINWFNSIANRVFEASKFTVQAGLDLYKASIQKYNALVDVYKAKVQVYEAVANVAVKKIEAQKLKLEQARLVGELNKLAVDVYKSQIDALTAYVGKYRAELDASKTYLEMEQLKVNLYKTKVEAFATRVNAATAKYNMYNTKIEGEKARVQAYAAAADAYGKRVQGIKAGIDAQAATINAQADTNKALAAIYESDVKAFGAKVNAEVEEATATAKVYDTEIRGSEAMVKMHEVINTLKLKSIDTKLEEYKLEFQAALESAKLTVQQTMDKWKLTFNTLETMAQVIAQVAAAAMNSDALTTHLSEGYSFNQGNQVSCSDIHSYDETTI